MATAEGSTRNGPEPGSETSTVPERAGWVLAALIAVATVANLGLAVANVALPDIGQHFDAPQTNLNLVAVAYSLGLACSVLYFGAVGDRYRRKSILLGAFLTAGYAAAAKGKSSA
jgi:DHA2 family multidrug resistance protein-like MFS transporter